MSELEQAKAKLIDTVGRYNLTVNNVAKFQFNDRETELFATMMVEFMQEQANGVSDTHKPALPIQNVSKCYSENDMDDAYDKGFKDGAQAAATDILG